MGEFRTPIKFGIAPQEVSSALPMLPQELVGTAGSYNVNTNPYVFHWVLEGCHKTSPADEKYRNVRVACMFSKPITGAPKMREITGAPFPDVVTLDFDATGPDGKLLGWELTFSVPLESYKTTNAVIRHQRDNTTLGQLGPPDEADEANATWYFFVGDTTEQLEAVSMHVNRQGRAFVTTLTVTDVEHERVKQSPIGSAVIGRSGREQSSGR